MRRLQVQATIAVLTMLLVPACDANDEDPPTATTGAKTLATATSPVATTAAATPSSEALAPTAGATATEESTAASTSSGTTVVSLLGHEVTLPAGFTISIYAEGLGSPRFMAYDENGVLFVTDSDGRVLRVPDTDGDGAADDIVVVARDLAAPHGITFHDGVLYVAETHRVVRIVDANSDGIYEAPVPAVEGLPEGGHWSRTIRFGPDGMLYVSVGSSCNACIEDDPLRAAITRFNVDGSGRETVAIGLRNAVGIAFSPETGQLWATNNGRDGMGDDVPPETLNQVDPGDDFGWPRCHSGDIPDPDLGGADACAGAAPPSVEMQAHSAPLGLAFYTAEQFGPEFRGDLFIAFHGSWDREEPTGYKVVRLPFENGQPTGEVLDFATGWLLDDGQWWGRPVDVIVAPDGSLHVSDDAEGRIFRISRQP
jgi:glucose/arabinose dehydrogenase